MHKRIHLGFGVLALAMVAACSSTGGSGTTGHTITLQARVEIRDDLTQPFTNASGWEISLSQAYLSLGALYYFSGAPVISRRALPIREKRGVMPTLADLLVPSAMAHPGHYVEGTAMGQMVEARVVDLLAGPSELGQGEGVTGEVNSARVTLQSPAKGALAEKLENQVVIARGTARQGDRTIPFVAKAAESDVLDGNGKAQISGCAFGATLGDVGVDVVEDGSVTLGLVPSVWFNQVDFSYVSPEVSQSPTVDLWGYVDLGGTFAGQAFIRGVKKGTAYDFAYSK